MACVTPCQQPCAMPKLLGPPHPISGYTGHIPMFKFRSSIGNCGCPSMCPQNPRQSCTKEPITIKFDNEESLRPCCPKGPGYQLRPTPPMDLFEVLTDQRLGQCGCCEFVPPAKTCGFSMASPTFQTILNHPYAPHCNRFCTATFEQDQWRDRLFANEASKMNAWRATCKTSSWDRPERLRPWDGDHAEFQEYPNTASPCKLYKQVRAAIQKDLDSRNIGDCIKPPFFDDVAQDCRPSTICGPTNSVKLLNREMTGPFPRTIVDGLPEILGEHPLLTLHRSAEEREVYSGSFYPEERGLARVCNPKDRSYLTAAPFRGNPIYRCCESVKSSFAGHVPGEQSHLTVGQNRNLSSRNALKYLTYRI